MEHLENEDQIQIFNVFLETLKGISMNNSASGIVLGNVWEKLDTELQNGPYLEKVAQFLVSNRLVGQTMHRGSGQDKITYRPVPELYAYDDYHDFIEQRLKARIREEMRDEVEKEKRDIMQKMRGDFRSISSTLEGQRTDLKKIQDWKKIQDKKAACRRRWGWVWEIIRTVAAVGVAYLTFLYGNGVLNESKPPIKIEEIDGYTDPNNRIDSLEEELDSLRIIIRDFTSQDSTK